MLTFNLKKEWFEKIKSGEKTHEYRVYKPYWRKRFEKFFNCDLSAVKLRFGNEIAIVPPQYYITFVCGYARTEDFDKRLLAKVKTIKLRWRAKTDFRFEYYDKTFEHEDFDEALAGLVNTLWQDLTEEERKQIKEILE